MPTAPSASRGLRRQPMAYDEYRALPELLRAEWVDGEAVMAPSPSYRHQQVSRRIANLLESALPGLFVVEAVTVLLPHGRERIPDVVVLDAEPEEAHVTATPLIAVEVLSASTRSEDTVRKSTEYLAAGIGQYWIVDPDAPTVEVFEGTATGWKALSRLDESRARDMVRVGSHGDVEIDLGHILG